MIDAVLDGIKFGIVLSLLIGPVFFTILQASIERGFWIGVLVAVGVSLSDILYVIVAYYGLSSVVDNPAVRIYMGYGGGLILFGFGAYYLLYKSRLNNVSNPGAIREKSLLMYIGKGFLINAMSPMVPLFWIGTVSIATIDLGYSASLPFTLFFSGVLGTVLATDIGKAYLSGKLRDLITHRSLTIMNVVVGLALMVFGGRLIIVTLQTT